MTNCIHHGKPVIISAGCEDCGKFIFSATTNNGSRIISPAELRHIVEAAHMAGQADAGVDPGYSNARDYYDEVFGS